MSWNKVPGCSVGLTPPEFKQFTQTLDKIVSEQQKGSFLPVNPKPLWFSRQLNAPIAIVYFLSLPNESPNEGGDYVCTVSYNFHEVENADVLPNVLRNISRRRFDCYLGFFSSQREVAERGEKYVDEIWQGILGQTAQKQAP